MARKVIKEQDVYANEIEDKIVEVPETYQDDNFSNDFDDFGMDMDSFREDW